jgi:hypothetical protein
MTDTGLRFALGMRSPESNFIAVWRLRGDARVHLPNADPKMTVLYPSNLGIQIEPEGEGLAVVFPREMMACILTADS